jgi:chromosome segregation ATPase
MTQAHTSDQHAKFRVENIGGIEETSVEISSGVTVLSGRNATNRTSFLQSIMAVIGSDNVSLKGDADKGLVSLTLDGEEYTRNLARTDGTVTTSGNPYLEDPEIADLFAFLLESNESRRAVARGGDLRELVMRPVDTESIQSEIRQLEREKSRVDDELEELQSLKGKLPELEQERSRLEERIDEKRAELASKEDEIESLDADIDETREEKQELEARLDELRDKRATLERIRSDIDLQQESIESLTAERRELIAQRDELPDMPMGEHDELEDEIARLRDRKGNLENDVSDLQGVIQFNEEQLEESEASIANALEDGGGSVTDELVDDTVVCWTCGSEVDTDSITNTLDQLREVRREKLETIRSLKSDLEELKKKKQEYRKKQQESERIGRKIDEIDNEIEERKRQLSDLRDERERLSEEIDALESEVEKLESDEFSDILDLHKEANQLEFELGELESNLDDVTTRIASVEEQLAEEDQLESQREEIRTELTELRTRIEQIEENAVEQFNTHMDSVLDILGYENLERIWIERVEREVREGRKKVEKTVFELHIVRSTPSGATYEDTVDHLSESEREVTGLVFALAGYLVHEVYETVPFMLLDSLEAIDSQRLAELVDYLAQYPQFLVVALLPEDARELDDEYARVTDI